MEDVVGIAPLPRLGAQLILGMTSLLWLLQGLNGPTIWQIIFGVGCFVWIVAYVNAFNFMDGINGISAAQVLVATAAWWAIGQVEGVPSLANPSVVVGAATLAFVPFNFPKAWAFLGDVGSYFLGAWLAVLVIIGLRAGLPPEAVIAPLSVYLTDTAVTIVRRVRRREVWYLPHRGHIYQRLTHLGWSHTATTLTLAVTMVTASVLGTLSLYGLLAVRIAGDIALAALLAAYLASPTLLNRRHDSRAAPGPTCEKEDRCTS